MSLLDANMYVSESYLDFCRSWSFFTADPDSQGCFSNVRLHAYHHGPYDSSRQHLLSGLLTIDPLDTFQFAAGQREVFGAQDHPSISA